ncbi:MAG: pantoate--beta-alanine ligase [Phycisphaerales bacterium]|jgi:pantoate--beta-alanine ligase|nr:pantoate--beta-alanine ligase [Phycisphaeraceae bacterium]
MSDARTVTVIDEPNGLDAAAGCIFVPTMGALHEGHASLIRQARTLADAARGARPRVMVSIFVNPTQFNDPADLSRYPRTFDSDLTLCAQSGADVIFAPSVKTMYPPSDMPPVPTLPMAATEPGLEDALRPGHFAGVCQVVLRLFRLVRPRACILGEKDWQQLAVLSAMTKEQGLNIAIVPGPTIREADGLAMSSRNRFIPPADRPRAAQISAALRAAGTVGSPAAAELAMRRVLAEAGLEVQYAVVRQAATLTAMPIDWRERNVKGRALIAAVLGPVRLIDNAPWPSGEV